jgi:hypothetical protein
MAASPTIKRAQLVLFLVWTGIALCAPLWWGIRLQRSHSLVLYADASGGDLDAVKQLARRPLTSVAWLEELALDRNAVADARVEAIEALSQKNAVDSKSLRFLLAIDQPFNVRHAAANAFQKHGCDDLCVTNVLNSLRAIWSGQPTFEMRLPLPTPDLRDQSVQIDRKLRSETERDYVGLLNSTPCLTRQILAKSYSTDLTFIHRLDTKLPRC